MNHNLTWQQSAWLAGALAVAALVLWLGAKRAGAKRADPEHAGSRSYSGRFRALRFAEFFREASLVVALYSVWQWVGVAAARSTHGAIERGLGIVELQHTLHLPDEHTLQGWIVPHSVLTQACNLYYAVAHFPAMIAVLIWLFLRHRDRYGPVRTVVAVSTAVCFAVSLITVAPPRLLPDAGFVDTAESYGQSVYSAVSALGPNQLAAMPSVHVGWAFIVAVVVWRLGGRTWRWIGPVHLVATVFVVAATANHYWLDGIVAIVIVVLTALAYREAARLFRTASQRRRRTSIPAMPAVSPQPSRTSARPRDSTGGTAPSGADRTSSGATCAPPPSSAGSRPSPPSSPRPDPPHTRPREPSSR